MEKLGYKFVSNVRDVASMEAEAPESDAISAEHTLVGITRKECEQEILGGMFAFLRHHIPDSWVESNCLHLQRRGLGCCSHCNRSTQWLFNYGPFLYWRKCSIHFSINERVLHFAFWEFPNSGVSKW